MPKPAVPIATYRVQLRPGFGFAEARRLVPYLRDLGVSHLYASPVFAARAGSTHGYDIVDPGRLNPQLGSEADFRALAEELHRHEMGLLLDIVPNHVSASGENAWWADVLERGQLSPFATFFDVDWEEGGARVLDWRSGRDNINYRRFFAIDDLPGLRVEDARVFDATHGLVLQLVRDDMADGLRVDHIDGLYDPLAYLQRLRSEIGGRQYVVVEKIVSGDERLPEGWPVQGTTGYDFLNALNSTFVDQAGLAALDDTYRRFARRKSGFADAVYERKRAAADEQFVPDFRRLARRLKDIADACDGPRRNQSVWRDALVEVSACLPVYRTYTRASRISDDARRLVGQALREVVRRCPEVDRRAVGFLRRVLFGEAPRSRRAEWLDFVMRWQQITGGAMAKGLEDSALYRYVPLASVNEVDANPRGPRGLSIGALHRWNEERLRAWPDTMNATSTHDTKRSEDVRARINVLSEMPDEWSRAVRRWRRMNAHHRRGDAPCVNEEWLLYQTLVGAWPLDEGDLPLFRERVRSYIVKAARESGERTSWFTPDEAYEHAIVHFVDGIVDDAGFLRDVRALQERIGWYGMNNSLSQVVLKAGSPGLPDFYQGTELWDFSLVDPDNRRQVDFEKRAQTLEGLSGRELANAIIPDLRDNWRDGRIKMVVTHKALRARRERSDLFARGDYVPLYASGWARRHVIAFGRRRGRRWAIVAAPRFVTSLAPVGKWPVGQGTWRQAKLRLPEGVPSRWLNALTGEEVDITPAGSEIAIRLSDVFVELPVALLMT